MTDRPPPSPAAASPSASEWAGARGEQWRAQLDGMEAMLAPVDEPLIGALRLDAASRIAEVGCGGGATALAIVARAPEGSVVHGFDISAALIEAARRRAGPAWRAVAFETADMAAAAPPAPLYDRLVSRFGIMFFDDPPAAFANLLRWLVPGGRFAFAAWGRPADNPWLTSVREVVAEVVEVPSPAPDAPGPFRYAEADKLVSLLERSGFGELEVHDWRGLLPIGGGLAPAEAARFALAAFSSFGALLAAAGDQATDRARQALTARFSGHQQAGAVRLDARVHLVTGARPRTS